MTPFKRGMFQKLKSACILTETYPYVCHTFYPEINFFFQLLCSITEK